MSEKLRLALKSSPDTISFLHEELETFADDNDLPSKVQAALQLSLEEIVLNAIVHGYKRVPDQDILVEVEVRPGELWMRVVDAAPPFNPWQTQAPDLDAPLMEREPGGLGIYLVSQLMDHVEYQYADSKNQVVMTRALSAPEE